MISQIECVFVFFIDDILLKFFTPNSFRSINIIRLENNQHFWVIFNLSWTSLVFMQICVFINIYKQQAINLNTSHMKIIFRLEIKADKMNSLSNSFHKFYFEFSWLPPLTFVNGLSFSKLRFVFVTRTKYILIWVHFEILLRISNGKFSIQMNIKMDLMQRFCQKIFNDDGLND